MPSRRRCSYHRAYRSRGVLQYAPTRLHRGHVHGRAFVLFVGAYCYTPPQGYTGAASIGAHASNHAVVFGNQVHGGENRGCHWPGTLIARTVTRERHMGGSCNDTPSTERQGQCKRTKTLHAPRAGRSLTPRNCSTPISPKCTQRIPTTRQRPAHPCRECRGHRVLRVTSDGNPLATRVRPTVGTNVGLGCGRYAQGAPFSRLPQSGIFCWPGARPITGLPSPTAIGRRSTVPTACPGASTPTASSGKPILMACPSPHT